MTHYNCGGPGDGTRPDGNTHWDACDCVADRLRREGEARVVAWLREYAAEVERHNPAGAYTLTPSLVRGIATRIEDGEHLRGENEGG